MDALAAKLKTCRDPGETIIEEMVGKLCAPSPTVYMVGSKPCVVADQLLANGGTVNLGNVSPSVEIEPQTMRKMTDACVELAKYLGLRGQWGVDFVFDGSSKPVMVDLNMGRPNGSLSYYCWRARQPAPLAQDSQQALSLVATTTEMSPWLAALPLSNFAALVKKAGLLWDSQIGRGIILAQHLPNFQGGGTVLAASWHGAGPGLLLKDSFLQLLKSLENNQRMLSTSISETDKDTAEPVDADRGEPADCWLEIVN